MMFWCSGKRLRQALLCGSVFLFSSVFCVAHAGDGANAGSIAETRGGLPVVLALYEELESASRARSLLAHQRNWRAFEKEKVQLLVKLRLTHRLWLMVAGSLGGAPGQGRVDVHFREALTEADAQGLVPPRWVYAKYVQVVRGRSSDRRALAMGEQLSQREQWSDAARVYAALAEVAEQATERALALFMQARCLERAAHVEVGGLPVHAKARFSLSKQQLCSLWQAYDSYARVLYLTKGDLFFAARTALACVEPYFRRDSAAFVECTYCTN